MTDAQSERSSMSHNGAKPPTDELNQHGRRVQELIAEIEALPDSNARELLQECMQEVLAFYGLGFDRVLEVAKSATLGQNAYEKLVHDSVVSGSIADSRTASRPTRDPSA